MLNSLTRKERRIKNGLEQLWFWAVLRSAFAWCLPKMLKVVGRQDSQRQDGQIWQALDLTKVCEYFDSLLCWAQVSSLMAIHKCLHKRLGCLLAQTFLNSSL